MRDVIYEMSRKGLGMTCGRREGRRGWPGIITDGDLRRQDGAPRQHPRAARRSDVMTAEPGGDPAATMAVEALAHDGTAQDHLDRGDRRGSRASRASCTCTTSGAPRWSRPADLNFGDSLPLPRGARRAARSAWRSARRGSATSCATASGSIGARARESHHYVLGLNFLVVEPDRSRDRGAERRRRASDSDALEIHLILGNVHRERGQVARAIQVHQALLQRPEAHQGRARLRPAVPRPRLQARRLRRSRARGVQRSDPAWIPRTSYALLYLQKLHEEQHQWADAHRIRKQLVALSGPDTQPRNQAILGFLENELGTEALAVGDRGRARGTSSRRSIRIPTRRRRYLNLGDVRFIAGRPRGRRDGVGRTDRALARARLPRLRSPRAALRAAGPAAAVRGALPAADRRQSAGLARAAGARPAPRRRATVRRGVRVPARGARTQPARPHRAPGGVERAAEAGPESRARAALHRISARSSVFFLDPHVCLKCHYRSTELLWQCPHCHEWNSFVEERIAPAKESDRRDVAEVLLRGRELLRSTRRPARWCRRRCRRCG